MEMSFGISRALGQGQRRKWPENYRSMD